MRSSNWSRRVVTSRIFIAIAALACGETPTALRSIPTIDPSAPEQLVTRVACVADVRARQVVCGTGDSSSSATQFKGFAPNGISRDLIIGGQNVFVKLTSSNVAYGGDVFSFDVTVQNLIPAPQKLGTADGTTLDPNGVRVFFVDPPVFTSGSGTIDFFDPVGGASMVDGFTTFTHSNQAFYQYNQILATGQTTSSHHWRIHIPSTVLSFSFFVYVSAPAQFPTGWIDVAPTTATLQVGDTQALSATVRDAVGRTLTGQTVTWGSAPPAVATVDPNTGVVTAVADGSATITATSTTRSGTAVITVATPSLMTIDAGDAQTALVGAAVATPPSVIVRDQNNNPVPNIPVTFSVTGGGGSATLLSTTTNASGIAAVGSWTLGAGGAGCSAAAITSCSRNTLHAVATGGSSPSIDIKGYVPPTLPATATYQAVGNSTLPVAAGIGLLQNALSINGTGANGQGATLAVTTLTPAGSQGGTATIVSDGGFSYLSSPTYVSAGAATENFTYTVSDGLATITTNATLQVNVPEHVWYVQPGYPGTSTGSDVQPFRDFRTTPNAGVESVAQANDTILVQTGTGSAAGGVLLSGQFVYGQGASAAKTFTTGAIGTYRNGGTVITLLAAGVSPQVRTTNLGSGNNLRGFTLVGGGTIALTGTGFGVLTVSEMIINSGATQALDLSTGTVSGSFTSITSTGGVNNVNLNAVGTSGTVALGSGALSGATSDAFKITGAAGTFTYSGSIANVATLAVNISGMTGGAVTLSGNINTLASPGLGVSITGNTGGTFTLSGAEIGISSGAANGVTLTGNAAAATINITPATGLQIATTSGVGYNATGAGTISLTGAGNTVNASSGQAVNVTGMNIGGTGIAFSNVTSVGGSSNVVMTTITGSGPIALGAGALSGASGTAFALQGGTGAVTYSGTISKVAFGQLVSVSGRTAGNVTLSGNLSCTASCGTNFGAIAVGTVTGGTISFSGSTKTITTPAAGSIGVTLTNNTGALINFTGGGLAVQTTDGTAFNATGGGTITVQSGGNPNTLTSTSGTALNVNATTIGGSGLTFRSISSGSGASSTANGIILDVTGSSGGLTVTGNGGAGTGGTIQHKTGSDGSTTQGTGIYLNSTSGVSLTWMQLNDFQNFGIRGTNVTGFSLSNSTINGINGTTEAGGSEEGPIRFDGLLTSVAFPTAAISGSVLSGAFSVNLRVQNTSGTLNRLVVNNTTLGPVNSSGTNGGSSIVFDAASGATFNWTVSNSNVTGSRSTMLIGTGHGGSHMDAVVLQNKFINADTHILSAAGVVLLQGGDLGVADFTFNVSCNKMSTSAAGGAKGAALNIFKATNASSGSFVGTVFGNAIGVGGQALSGAPDSAPGIWIQDHGAGSFTTLIQNNSIVEYGEEAIDLQRTLGSSTLNVSVFGNTLTPNASVAFAGLNVEQGAVNPDAGAMNLVAGSSSVGALKNDFSNGDPFDFSDIQVLRASGSSTVLNLSRNGSGSGTVTNVLKDDNLNPATTNVFVPTAGSMNLVGTVPALPPSVASCTLPP